MEDTTNTPSIPPPPQVDHGRRRRVGLAAAAILATGLVAGIIVASVTGAGAASSSPSSSTASNLPRKMIGHGFFGHDGFGFGALHGQFTIAAPSGGYETLDTQLGTVSAVSSSSITLKSADAFTATYSVDANTLVNAGRDGIANVKAGDTVHVVAIVSGGKASAVEIIDGTNVQNLRGRWAPGVPFPDAPGA